MNNKLLPWLLLFCALGLSGTAAYYSVVGLSIVFSGVAFPVIIMGSFLEVSKLAIATYLHNQWKNSGIGLKLYLTSALIVLSVITSIGIYGLLSKGFRENITQLDISSKQVKNIEIKKNRFSQSKDEYVLEKQNIDKDISNLREALATGTTTQYKDKETGQIITVNSSKIRKVYQDQLTEVTSSRDTMALKIEAMNDSLTSLDIQILEMQTSNEEANELGVIQTVSETIGWSLTDVANLFILLLIVVFDPLAISLVLATNQAFKNSKPKRDMYGEIKGSQLKNPTMYAPTESIVEEEWDEDHAHDMALNAMIEDLTDEELNDLPTEDKKITPNNTQASKEVETPTPDLPQNIQNEIDLIQKEIDKLNKSSISSKKRGLAVAHLQKQLKNLQLRRDTDVYSVSRTNENQIEY
tara:strand:+ start:165 stop:1397 length:1233 start_codon:yes stop_codon:yes gene_type:complete